MTNIIHQNIDAIKKICAENSVSELYLFGSALTNEFDENSDIDFAVVLKDDLSPIEFGDSFLNLLNELEKLLKRKIDLISYRVVKNQVFKEELDRTKLSIYAAA